MELYVKNTYKYSRDRIGLVLWLVGRNVIPRTTKDVDPETCPTFVNQVVHSATDAVSLFVCQNFTHHFILSTFHTFILLALTCVGEDGRNGSQPGADSSDNEQQRSVRSSHQSVFSTQTAALQNMIHALPASSVTGTIHKGLLKAIEWFFCVYTECASLIYLTGGSKGSCPAGHSIDVEIQIWKRNRSFCFHVSNCF